MFRILLRKQSIYVILLTLILIILTGRKKDKSDNHHQNVTRVNNKRNIIDIDLKSKKPVSVDECLLEWEELNNMIYFRKNLAFYYTDIKKIHLYFEMNSKNGFDNYKIDLMNNEILLKHDLNCRIIKLHTYSQYVFGYIEADFDLKNNNNKLTVIVKGDNNESTHNSIDLKIKQFNDNNNNNKKHSLLCGKSYYHTNNNLKHTEWWININKINGFDKIILFNNSYGNGSWKEYELLFNKYNNFIQIIQYQCLPNFISSNNNNNKPKYINFFDTKPLFNLNPIPYQQHFEYSTFNECLLLNRNKYKYIAIIDDDESILPRYSYNNELNESLYTNNYNYPHEIDTITNKSSKYIKYFNNLRNKFNLGQKSSLGFKWAAYLKHKHMKLIFNEIERILKLNGFQHTLNIIDKDEFTNTLELHGLHFKISINNEEDFKYAKYLYEMHIKYIESFLNQNNKQLELVPEPYNRFYYFNGGKSVRYSWYHKYIHDTSQTYRVNTHMSENQVSSSLLIPVNYGHVTHFRHEYREPFQWSELQSIPIKELYFDFVYFNDYFKPLLNDLS
jgi:hypothetical protein